MMGKENNLCRNILNGYKWDKMALVKAGENVCSDCGVR